MREGVDALIVVKWAPHSVHALAPASEYEPIGHGRASRSPCWVYAPAATDRSGATVPYPKHALPAGHRPVHVGNDWLSGSASAAYDPGAHRGG